MARTGSGSSSWFGHTSSVALQLDQAINLEHVGDTLYIGFNEDLEKVSFPKLVSVGGALIIEANPALKSIHLPALLRVAKYIHIHESAALVEVVMPKLKDVGGELSLIDCPNLTTVKVAVASQPAQGQRVVVQGCGQEVYPALHWRA